MALLFSRRWRNPDWRVREQAALQMRDEAKLLFLVLNDVAEAVRIAAVKGLSSDGARKRVVFECTCSRSREIAFSLVTEKAALDEILRQISVPDSFRLAALAKISPDAETLLTLVRKDPSLAVRQAALEKLPPSPELDACYLETDSLAFRLALIPKLGDRGLVRRIAREGREPEARAAAISRLDDREELVRIFREEPVPEVRLAAARQVREEPVLLELLQEEDNDKVRDGICSLLTTEEFLTEVARKDFSAKVRLTAVGKLSSARVLIAIIQEETDEKIRLEALSRISDESKLVSLACSAEDEGIRRRAMARLERKETWQTIAANSAFADTRWLAGRRLGEGRIEDLLSISNNKTLVEIVTDEPDEHLRAFAIRGISDEALLKKLEEGSDSANAAAARQVLAWERGPRDILFAPVPGRPYAISAFPITIRAWQAVMGSLPEHLAGKNLDQPATGLTLTKAHLFCEKLSVLDGRPCRLPTFDEWCHAVLAGRDRDGVAPAVAKVEKGSLAPPPVHLQGAGPRPQRQAWPNAWGILDAVGNVLVWLDDELPNADAIVRRRGYDRLSASDRQEVAGAEEFAVAAGNHWDEKRLTPGRWERFVCLSSLDGYGQDKIGFRVLREQETAGGSWQHSLILLPEVQVGLSRDKTIENLTQTTVVPRGKLEHYFDVAPVAVRTSADYSVLLNFKKAWDRAGAKMTIKTDPPKAPGL